VLDPESFERFSTFRKIRKEIADDEGVPAFAVFADSELAEMAKIPDLSATSMKAVRGIGEKKIEKYGRFFTRKPLEGEAG
jgi:ATP-dependent DNA helicase RecQ